MPHRNKVSWTRKRRNTLHATLFHTKKFDRIGETSSATFPSFRYVAPSEICAKRNWFDRPIAKWELKQIFDVESSRAGP